MTARVLRGPELENLSVVSNDCGARGAFLAGAPGAVWMNRTKKILRLKSVRYTTLCGAYM